MAKAKTQKPKIDVKKAIISLIFIIAGIFLIRYSLMRPCDVAPISQVVQGQEITVEQPEQLDRLICVSTDYYALASMLLGVAAIFPGVSGLFKSLTEVRKEK